MAITRASLAVPSVTPAGAARSLDLKRSLALRVVAAALACFLAAAVLTLRGTYRELRLANETVADLIVRQLQLQLWRLEASIDLPARFPDWDPVADRAQSPGQCITFIKADGGLGRAACVGAGRSGAGLPAWLAALGAWLPGTDAARSVAFRDKAYGTVQVTTDPEAVLAAVWRDVSGLLGLTALVGAATCLLQYLAISRALRPTRDILAGLDRLAHGDLSCRLPSFRLVELRRISDVFNALAAGLDRTTRERSQLAARLVDGQEEERRHLARELHDELAQTLSAMSATAASIQATAEARCPELVPEASRLAQTSMALMRSLRATLEALRPPEVEDFGLAAALAALAREQEQRAGGALRITLDIADALDGLPPTAAVHVYRIVQEALTNVARHAEARHARVVLAVRPGRIGAGEAAPRRWLALTVEDDGCGGGGRGGPASGGGLGLVGMRERALALGGQLDAVRLERGFRVEAVIPFAAEEPVQ